MSVEPKPANSDSEMTTEEAQMALELIRSLEAQIRNLEKQIADIDEQIIRQFGPDDDCSEDGTTQSQS